MGKQKQELKNGKIECSSFRMHLDRWAPVSNGGPLNAHSWESCRPALYLIQLTACHHFPAQTLWLMGHLPAPQLCHSKIYPYSLSIAHQLMTA